MARFSSNTSVVVLMTIFLVSMMLISQINAASSKTKFITGKSKFTMQEDNSLQSIAQLNPLQESTDLFTTTTLLVEPLIPEVGWKRSFSIDMLNPIGDDITGIINIAVLDDDAQEDGVIAWEDWVKPEEIACGTLTRSFNAKVTSNSLSFDVTTVPLTPGEKLEQFKCPGIYLNFVHRGNLATTLKISLDSNPLRSNTLEPIIIDDGLFKSLSSILTVRRGHDDFRLKNTRDFEIILSKPVIDLKTVTFTTSLSIIAYTSSVDTVCTLSGHENVFVHLINSKTVELYLDLKTTDQDQMVLKCPTLLFLFQNEEINKPYTITLSVPRKPQSIEMYPIDDNAEVVLPQPGPFAQQINVEMTKFGDEHGALVLNKRDFVFVIKNPNFTVNSKVLISSSPSIITAVTPAPKKSQCTAYLANGLKVFVDAVVGANGLELDFNDDAKIKMDTLSIRLTCQNFAILDFTQNLDTPIKYNIKYDAAQTTTSDFDGAAVYDVQPKTNFFETFEVKLEKVQNKPLTRTFQLIGTNAKVNINTPVKLFVGNDLIQHGEAAPTCYSNTSQKMIPTSLTPNALIPVTDGTAGYSIIFDFSATPVLERTGVTITCEESLYFSFSKNNLSQLTTPLSLFFVSDPSVGENTSVGPIRDDKDDSPWDFGLVIPLRATYQSSVSLSFTSFPTSVLDPLTRNVDISFTLNGAQVKDTKDHRMMYSVWYGTEAKSIDITTPITITTTGLITTTLHLAPQWTKFTVQINAFIEGPVGKDGFNVEGLGVEYDRGLVIYRPDTKSTTHFPLDPSFVTKDITVPMKKYVTRKGVGSDDKRIPLLELAFSKTTRAINFPIALTTNVTTISTPFFWIDPNHQNDINCNIPEFKNVKVPVTFDSEKQNLSIDFSKVSELSSETKKDFVLFCDKIGLLKPSTSNSFVALTLSGGVAVNNVSEEDQGVNNNDFFGLDIDTSAHDDHFAYSFVTQVVPEKQGFPKWAAYLIVFAVVGGLSLIVWVLRKVLGLGQDNTPTNESSSLVDNKVSSTSVNSDNDATLSTLA